MALVELNGADAVRTALTQNACVLLTFSAHWCGPCRASKPALQQLAERYSNPPSLSFGIVYEDTLREDIHMYRIRAFPTYVFFRNGTELERVEGANLPAVETMVQKNRPTTIQQMTGGETLGGGGSEVLSPEAARAARIARLAASTTIAGEDTTPATATKENEQAKKDGDDDVEMKDAQNPPSSSEAAEIVHNESSAEATVDPTENLDPQALKTLIEDMGFTELRAQKGLLYGTGGTLEGAVEWLMQHQDDTDIDEPITATTTAENAQSYKCNECGKVLSNMANLELHANKTGHSDFEESTETVKPLTDEEKAAKIAEIKVRRKTEMIYLFSGWVRPHDYKPSSSFFLKNK
jgi:thiol-disulfide isomerase/thioredoxin